MIIIQQLVMKFGGQTPSEAYLLQFFSICYDMCADKDKNCVKAAKTAADSLYGIFPVEASGSIVIEHLVIYHLQLSGIRKWQH